MLSFSQQTGLRGSETSFCAECWVCMQPPQPHPRPWLLSSRPPQDSKFSAHPNGGPRAEGTRSDSLEAKHMLWGGVGASGTLGKGDILVPCCLVPTLGNMRKCTSSKGNGTQGRPHWPYFPSALPGQEGGGEGTQQRLGSQDKSGLLKHTQLRSTGL